jgi:hypothetical protein
MFATLWYAGVVVMWMGFQGMSSDVCESIKKQMETDIENSYSDPVIAKDLLYDGFELDGWNVTCERRVPVPNG